MSWERVGIIRELKRRPNSLEGNPTWAFKLDVEGEPAVLRLQTGVNIGGAYLLSNNSEGSRVKVTCSGKRTVQEIELL